MTTRRDFIKASAVLATGAAILPGFATPPAKLKAVGLQLYTVREEMAADAVGTLKQLAKIGFRELESARSDKGNYYGLSPKEISKICRDLGMTLRSGHVHLDKDWQQSIDQAAEAGQKYLICSSLPSEAQTIANYQKCADLFSKAGEDCKKANLIFGYHNHEAEFEKDGGQVLYDILLDRTDPSNVIMELDLGWIIMAGFKPEDYFAKYPGRFPLWHLKDMDRNKKQSTEFGKGQVDIKGLLNMQKESGLKYCFVEQEEYAHSAIESLIYDFHYLQQLK